jgi:hypothetical protein
VRTLCRARGVLHETIHHFSLRCTTNKRLIPSSGVPKASIIVMMKRPSRNTKRTDDQ